MKEFREKEISWLSFNARVLQEANDPTVPILDRLKFIGIYSSNLDEFYEIRVATLIRLSSLGKKAIDIIGNDPKRILAELQDIVWTKHFEFDKCFLNILTELENRGVYIINEQEMVDETQKEYLQEFFDNNVRPKIFPIMLNAKSTLPNLKDRAIYLMVKLSMENDPDERQYSLIEVPTEFLPRFTILPAIHGKKYVMMLDDVIRFGLKDIFSSFEYDKFTAYDIKVTRDAELDIENDLSSSIMSKVTKGLKKRHLGSPVRIGYDSTVPEDMLQFFLKKLKLKNDETVLPGGRYHNFKDFVDFPNVLVGGGSRHRQEKILHKDIVGKKSIISAIRRKDILFHFPYQSFHNIIDLIREASIDPKVTDIKVTLYRVAKNSSVVNALINAVKNGKSVTVLLEIQARFDESANIYWANVLKEEGANVLLGIPGLKVHSKLAIITRKEGGKSVQYCCIGTGNFNEQTAKIYTDHYMMTANKKIANEVADLFDFFEKTYVSKDFKTLIVSPFSMRKRFTKMIQREIDNSLSGKTAYIDMKLNNVADPDIIKHLYRASQAGVKIRMIVRGMFSLVPGVPGLSENIEARSIVDRYLEHGRVYIFANGGDEQCYISSADFLPRNINSRIEVTCPVLDRDLHQELRDIFELAWRDNVKSRILDENLQNRYYEHSGVRHRFQDELFQYLKDKHHRTTNEEE